MNVRTADKEMTLIRKRASGSDGLIRTKDIEELGIGRYRIRDHIEKGLLVRVSKGLFYVADEIPEEYVLIQGRSEKLVFSHETALFLQGLSDRIPLKIDITLPQGYNAARLKRDHPDLRIHYVKKELLNVDLQTINTPQGSKIAVYGRKRCLCDAIKNYRHMDKETYINAVKTFFSEGYDVNELIKTARLLGKEKEVRRYMEVL